ncbi:MAG: response regulator [Rhodoferax sp.]|uniref:hybrid sensor histidine kinase/response regulator n=1 Tax=Rhodoferax sp. TaxID=50421 RepID=UPI0026105B01|nr:response regulator [Rhodoferax sp.]MDD2882335.1 response regulator [Rhodoferax sp.]
MVSYLLAIVFSVIALVFRLSIAPAGDGLQFVTFFPTVAITALLLGTRPALLTTVACSIMALYFLFPPYGAFSFVVQHYALLAVLLFCANSVIVSLSIGAMQRYLSDFVDANQALQKTLLENKVVQAEIEEQNLVLAQREAQLTKYKAIIDSTDEAVIGKTLQGIVTSWNEGASGLYGFTAAETIGQSMTMMIPSDRLEEESDILARIARGEKVEHFETVRRCKDGQFIDISATISPIRDGSGAVIGASKIARDITRRKLLEAELRVAKTAAEAATRAKSSFLANMSHEIRTPMNALLGLTRVVLDSELKPEQRDLLVKVNKSGRALVRIINDILDFSRMEAGRMVIENVPMAVESLLQDVADLFGAQMQEQGIELFLDISPDTPLHVVGDPLRLTQVLNNLIGNAVKFTERGEIHVAVTVERHGDASMLLRFEVRDTGIGIDQCDVANLFESFAQADGAITRKYGGSGLGLSIAKTLIELMGGSITMKSTLGKGTSVAFTVKVGGAPDSQRSVGHLGHDLQQLHGKRVLVVDDQETSRIILSRLLTAWGLVPVEAANGEQALAHILEANNSGQTFHAMLLDWRMPGMDGLEVAARIKKMEAAGELVTPPKIVMVTAYDKHALLQNADSRYVDALLTKPVVPSSLFDALLNNEPSHSSSGMEVAQRFDGMRVLLAEDHELNQEVAANFMAKRGITVTIAWNGQEALQYVQRQTFDLVLMDLHMPVMGGIEAANRIHDLPGCKNLPIAAMTAAVMAEDRLRCIAAGMIDFVPKPVEPEDLLRVIGKYYKADTQAVAVALQPPTKVTVHTMPALLDLVSGLRRLDGDHALQQRLLSGFVERHGTTVAQFEMLMAQQDISGAIDLVHTLKGIAANLGASALAQACSGLIENLRNDQQQNSLPAFQVILCETLLQMQQHLSQHNTPGTAAQGHEAMNLRETLLSLQPFVADQEVIPDELSAELNQLLQTNLPCPPLLRQLHQHLINFEHEQALQCLLQLVSELEVTP